MEETLEMAISHLEFKQLLLQYVQSTKDRWLQIQIYVTIFF